MLLHAVRALDGLVDALAQGVPDTAVVLDGQVVLLEDYLSIRPGQLSAVVEAVQSGRLLIGPWYIQPHQPLSGPEALVRNLLIGGRMARQFGDCLPIAFLPESKSVTPQLPQILNGFGITSVVAHPAASDSTGTARWRSPDGSVVVVFDIVPGPQHNSVTEPGTEDWAAELGANLRGQGSLLIPLPTVNGTEVRDPSLLLASLEPGKSGVKIKHLGLPEAVAAVQAGGQFSPAPLEDALSQTFHSGSLSSRIQLKLRNHQVETLLTSWAEPYSAWCWLLESSSQDSHETAGQPALDVLTSAWKSLLESQYQPTLAGCVVDSVYREALHRFDHAGQLAEELVSESLRVLTARIATESGRKRRPGTPVVVFNPSTARRTDLASIRLSTPLSEQSYELVDEAGQQIAFDLVTSQPAALRFVAGEVPPVGYKTYFLREGADGLTGPSHRDEQPTIENEFLAVTFDPLTGLLTAFDKRTGRSFNGLNQFVDEGDSGSLDEYQSPLRDTVIDVATNTPIFVEREISTVDQTLTYLQIYRLPRQLTEQRDARLPLAAQFVPVSISSEVRLAAGVPRIDVRASIANDAIDHRLKVCFMFGSDIRGLSVDGHYQIRDVSDELVIPREGEPGHTLRLAQRAFVTLWGADTGLTIASRGLPEVIVGDGPAGGQVALTLIRATGHLQAGSGWVETPLAQCLGETVLEYSIIPHGLDALWAWREAWAYQSPLRAVETDPHRGALPLEASLVEADNPRFVISAVKTGEDGRSLIVRGYSISDQLETVTLRHGLGRMSAQRVRLDETPTGEPIEAVAGNGFAFEFRPAQVVTIRLARV